MIPLFKVFMSKTVDKPLLDVLHSGHITQGGKVDEFEERLKEWFNYPYIITLNSATSGLTLALRMLNLSEGDEVLCTPLTCTATNWSVLANKLSIKWVDVNTETCNMDLTDLERKITEKTKAILFVHWGGSAINLEKLTEIRDVAEQKYNININIIEDCAHAFGAMYKNKKIGTHGNYSICSLQAIKHLTTGDGGLLFLPSETEYKRAKLLRWYGIDREDKKRGDFRLENDVKEWGYKFHMNDINATIGLCNLPFIDNNLSKNRKNAYYYDKYLSDIPGVELLKQEVDAVSSYWIYTIKVVNKHSFIGYMKQKGIMVSQVHNRNDKHSCVKNFRVQLPNLDYIEKYIVSIPVGWWITVKEREYILSCIREWSNKYYFIRKLTTNDKEDYISLITQLSGQYNKNNNFNHINHKEIYVLINEERKVVSTAKLIIEPKLYDPVAHIEDVVTDVKQRNRGYGTVLINYLLNQAIKEGCYKTILNCKKEYKGFYTRFTNEGLEMVYRKKNM